MRDDFLGPNRYKLSAGGRQFVFGMHAPRHAQNADAAFDGVADIADCVSDQHDLILRYLRWPMALDVSRFAMAVYRVACIGKKTADASALVRLYVAAEHMRKAVLQARGRQNTTDCGRRIG